MINSKLKKFKIRKKKPTKMDFQYCPNCGEEEVGKYCPNCGQANKDFNKPMKEVLNELMDSINLDVRLVNTIIPFFTKPGFLTDEYFKGRRKRYVPPVRMYMFFSIIFFFLAQNSVSREGNAANEAAIKSQNKSNPGSTQKQTESAIQDSDTLALNNFILNLDSTLSKEEKENVKEATRLNSSTTSWEKQLVIGGLKAAENKDLFRERFLNTLSYLLFLLMPVFALLLAILFWKSKMLYVKHLIFSINFHSFIFGSSVIILILNRILPEAITNLTYYLWLTIPVYLFLGIQRFYKRKYLTAFLKMLVAILFYCLIVSIVLIVILAVTAKGFY